VRRYRTYTDADFRKLREIEALRFLGFTRTQIKSLLRGGRADIIEAIHAQRLTVEHSLKQLARASEMLAESEPTCAAAISRVRFSLCASGMR
jgi:MerR family transcriptional regulator, thiopeptide resistance regulator